MRIFDGNTWGLQWFTNGFSPNGVFPQFFKHDGQNILPVAAADVPAATKLRAQEVKLVEPGPKLGPFTTRLADGSVLIYSWYRFVDQPSFQQYQWSVQKKAKLQALVEKLHANWPI